MNNLVVFVIPNQESAIVPSFQDLVRKVRDEGWTIDAKSLGAQGPCSDPGPPGEPGWCGTCPAPDAQIAINILRKLDGIRPLGDIAYDIREREGQDWTGPKVVAWGLACAQMQQLFKRDDARHKKPVIYGGHHNGPLVPPEMQVKEVGSWYGRDAYSMPQVYEEQVYAQPPVVKFQGWPADWPPYYHRNEPCDTLVGYCGCGTYHTEGEFTLEQDGLRDPYVSRNIFNWPAEHTGGGAYSSLCSCKACSDLRASAQRRTDYQRQAKSKPKQQPDNDRSSELRGREFRKLMGD